LVLPRLDPAFHGYRLVQISDLHTDISLTRAHLVDIVERINRQEPDLVAITGDFVSYHAQPYVEDIAATLSQLKPRDVTVAVLGKHDYWVEVDLIRQALSGAASLN
jgi:predicted MPP superfamily phosphohydrolase